MTVSAPQYMTIGQAAEMLLVDARSIRRYIAAGRLTAYRLGPRVVRLKASDVEALLEVIPTTKAGA